MKTCAYKKFGPENLEKLRRYSKNMYNLLRLNIQYDLNVLQKYGIR